MTVADELLQLIKKEYINRNNQFQSTKFRIDHPKKYSQLFYHFKTNEKGTTLQKVLKELDCVETSKDLIDMSPKESKGVAAVFFYCDLKKLLEKGFTISQIAKHLNVTRQALSQRYHRLNKRFSE